MDEYNNWLQKSASQNVLIPLPKTEIEYEELPIRKYQGFLEAMIKGLVKFKEEKEERARLEEIKRQKELEMKKSIKPGKTRKTRRDKRFAESSGSVTKLTHSRSKASHSQSRKKLKDMSKSTIRSRNRKNVTNAKHIQKNTKFKRKNNKNVSNSQIDNSQTMGQMETENTLPSIFDHKTFHKELRNIVKNLGTSKDDRYRRNESIFDLKKLKTKHFNLFSRRNHSVDLNSRSLVGHEKALEKEDRLANTSMIN